MTRKALIAAWNKFWFEPQSVRAICVFRIVFGLLCLQYLIQFVGPDLAMWFGPDRIIPLEANYRAQAALGGTRLDLLMLFPDTPQVVSTAYGVMLIAAVAVTLGWFYRIAIVVLFVTLASFHHHAFFYCNGSDNYLRIATFVLMFAPAANRYSLDAFFNRKLPSVASPWAQRLLQVQLTGCYFESFWAKSIGEQWWNGQAIYNVTHVTDWMRFPITFATDHIWVCMVLGWSVLLIELALCTLIWLPRCRPYVLFAGVLMHIGIDVAMVVPLFESLFLATYLLFVL